MIGRLETMVGGFVFLLFLEGAVHTHFGIHFLYIISGESRLDALNIAVIQGVAIIGIGELSIGVL